MTESTLMTKEIKHRFHFSCPPEKIVHALTHEPPIRLWWTEDANVTDGKGRFAWKGFGWTVELLMETDGQRRVTWRCIKSNMQNTHAWEGSTITFLLTPDSTGTQIDFTHSGYQDAPCYDACHEGWRYFLGESLKNYLETGTGLPYMAASFKH